MVGTRQSRDINSTARAILAVSFGTSFKESRENAIGGIERSLRRAFPDYQVRRAFTSGFIIRKIYKETGEKIDTVEEALERAEADGIRDLVVQPTHFMKGIEYDEMCAAVNRYRSRFERLNLAEPLLSSDADFRAVAEAIASGYSEEKTAVILMGHGTSKTDANAVYQKLQNTFTEAGYTNYYIATVEAKPTIQDIMKTIEGKAFRSVILRPLMVVAGDHACNDMAGEQPDSWKSMLEQAGYEVTAVLQGLGEDSSIRKIYIEHTRAALSERT